MFVLLFEDGLFLSPFDKGRHFAACEVSKSLLRGISASVHPVSRQSCAVLSSAASFQSFHHK